MSKVKKESVDPKEKVTLTKQELAIIMDCLVVAYSHINRYVTVEEAKELINIVKTQILQADGKS